MWFFLCGFPGGGTSVCGEDERVFSLSNFFFFFFGQTSLNIRETKKREESLTRVPPRRIHAAPRCNIDDLPVSRRPPFGRLMFYQIFMGLRVPSDIPWCICNVLSGEAWWERWWWSEVPGGGGGGGGSLVITAFWFLSSKSSGGFFRNCRGPEGEPWGTPGSSSPAYSLLLCGFTGRSTDLMLGPTRGPHCGVSSSHLIVIIISAIINNIWTKLYQHIF